MARRPRIIVPGIPHHVTQRGTRRQPVFFCHDDYATYKKILAEQCRRASVKIWAYCLMPNHIHLIVAPDSAAGLSRSIGDAHQRYSRLINKREDWSGHLWQERYYSCPLDESHLLAAVRYVEQNPVRAGLVKNVRDWHWSSAKAHLGDRDDDLVAVKPMQPYVSDWECYLEFQPVSAQLDIIRQGTHEGLPVGPEGFVAKLEKQYGMKLRSQVVGRQKNSDWCN